MRRRNILKATLSLLFLTSCQLEERYVQPAGLTAQNGAKIIGAKVSSTGPADTTLKAFPAAFDGHLIIDPSQAATSLLLGNNFDWHCPCLITPGPHDIEIHLTSSGPQSFQRGLAIMHLDAFAGATYYIKVQLISASSTESQVAEWIENQSGSDQTDKLTVDLENETEGSSDDAIMSLPQSPGHTPVFVQ